MKWNWGKRIAIVSAVVLATAVSITTVRAADLLADLEAGEPVRIGFANEVPWAYPGEDSEPLGFANAIAVGVLQKMGAQTIEPVVTEWGGLIPGLKASQFDVITGGMYILGARCENVLFSDPIGVFGDAFIVAKDNPEGIQTYEDIKRLGVTLVTGAGYNIVEVAKKQGIPEENIMQVPGPTEILAAVQAGRAAAGGVTYFTALNLAEASGGAVSVTDPSKLPGWTLNWVGIAFRPSDTAMQGAFNAALKDYLGSDEMMASVAPYGYTEAQLPGDATTAHACANR